MCVHTVLDGKIAQHTVGAMDDRVRHREGRGFIYFLTRGYRGVCPLVATTPCTDLPR